MRLLAIDPALRKTGFAIVESIAGKNRALAYGVIVNPPKIKASACLVRIHEKLTDLIEQHGATVCAVEAIIYVQSHRIAITLGAARGAAILAAASAGLPIYEYAPRKVKQAVVGRGAAEKSQVAFMVRALLGLSETPSPDEGDALAIAITHLNTLNNPLLVAEAEMI